MDMLTEVNLKDKNYLKAYEEQIQALPLDELYEVLDITKCPPKDQRDYSRALKIQNNIIDKMLLFVENNISK